MLTKVVRQVLENLDASSIQIYQIDMGFAHDGLFYMVDSSGKHRKLKPALFNKLKDAGWIMERTDLQPEKGETIYDISPLGREVLKEGRE